MFGGSVERYFQISRENLSKIFSAKQSLSGELKIAQQRLNKYYTIRRFIQNLRIFKRNF